MTTETSNARGEVVAWLRVRPDGTPDWAEDCIADDDHFLNRAMEADGYRLRPLIYADTAPPPAAACPNCDDTGDVTRADGEWRGVCTCPAGQPPAAARGDVRAVLQEMRDRQVARRFKSQTLTDWADRIESALATQHQEPTT